MEWAKWANATLRGRQLLHCGAGCCNTAAVSMLLSAGTDEAALNTGGLIPGDGMGVDGRL